MRDLQEPIMAILIITGFFTWVYGILWIIGTLMEKGFKKLISDEMLSEALNLNDLDDLDDHYEITCPVCARSFCYRDEREDEFIACLYCNEDIDIPKNNGEESNG